MMRSQGSNRRFNSRVGWCDDAQAGYSRTLTSDRSFRHRNRAGRRDSASKMAAVNWNGTHVLCILLSVMYDRKFELFCIPLQPKHYFTII